MDLLFGLILMLSAPGYLILQAAGIFVASREGWWPAFLAPLVFSVPLALWCAVAFAAESNLWPMPFILFAPLGSIYLLVVITARAVMAE